MKIVICGPAHSGKSVFLSNLINRTPNNARTTIRACPDGEGTWSNNINQQETSITRKKGEFTESFVDRDCQEIDRQTNKIVFVDVGGIRSKENEKIFTHCDSFIVLSNDEKEKEEWLKFGENLGLQCIGLFDSKLEGQEEMYETEPYLKGRIVGLERGKFINDSKILDDIASMIIQKSGYKDQKKIDLNKDTITINDTDLCFLLGYGKNERIGTLTIRKAIWPTEAIPDIYKYIDEKIDRTKSLKINGVKANFIISAICKASKQCGINDIKIFDVRLQEFIPVRSIPQERDISEANGLRYNVIENKENTFIDIDITKERYEIENLERCVIPKIKKEQSLYLSGRMPHWLLASICSSYDVNSIYTFQPGNGFVCVSSKEDEELGKIVREIKGIDTNKYFKEKKEKLENRKKDSEQK